jgi:hypothetical protein
VRAASTVKRRMLEIARSIRQTPPVGQGQAFDRFGQIVGSEHLGPVRRELVTDAGENVVRDPDRSAHLLAAWASLSDFAMASGNRSTALASDASAAGERRRPAIASAARAAARPGSTTGTVSVDSMGLDTTARPGRWPARIPRSDRSVRPKGRRQG